ncbi:glycosyltransferase family 4 protein [Thermomonas fusca]
MADSAPAIWFPAVRTCTGTDVFTERLVAGLRARGLRAEITWLPLRAEYAPWTVRVPKAPEWATVCHINTWLHPRFIPRQLPVVATLHHSIHDPALKPYKGWLRAAYHRWWIAPIERRVLRRADRVVAVSRFVAEMARQTLCDVPMEVIYNGIDTEVFRPGNRVRQPGEPFRLLYVGSWMARKGVDLLAPIMRGLGSEFELQYTGGPAAEKDKLTMPPNMHDVGRLTGPQVVAAMQGADAFLFPSRSEGLPLVAIEAMACGLSVIAMQGTSVEEVVAHGRTGLLCKREEVLAFAEAARAMATDRQLHLACGAAAREMAAAHFRESKMGDAYAQTYHDLLEGKA